MAEYTKYDLPLTLPLPKGFQNGTKIMIQGTIHHAAESFTVQFDCPEGIAFQMVGDFTKTSPEVVCNSQLNGKWGPGEINPMPQSIKQGQAFQMTITALSTNFDVDVMDEHKFTFSYRYKDLAKISPLEVKGDFSDDSVQVALDD